VTNEYNLADEMEFLYHETITLNSSLPDHLRTFAVAAKHLIFKQAAADLNVTPDAVSQRIQRLEQQIGIKLFKRRTRAISLTPKGEVLLSHVVDAIRNIELGLNKINELEQYTALTIYTTPVFAERWLLRQLPKFRSLYPSIPVQVNASATPVNFDSSRPELAIRFNQGQYKNCTRHKLLKDVYLPICSPCIGDKIAKNEELELRSKIYLIHCNWANRTGLSPTSTDWMHRYDSPLVAK